MCFHPSYQVGAYHLQVVYGKSAALVSVLLYSFFVSVAHHIGGLVTDGVYQYLHIVFVRVIHQPVGIGLVMHGGAVGVRSEIGAVHQRSSCSEGAVLIQLDRADGIIFAAVSRPVAFVDKLFHVVVGRKGRLLAYPQGQQALFLQLPVSLHYSLAVSPRQREKVVRLYTCDSCGVYVPLRR